MEIIIPIDLLIKEPSPKTHIYPPSHSLYLHTSNNLHNIESASSDDENLNDKDCSKILNRFKAYSENLKSSASKSMRASLLEEEFPDDKNSSLCSCTEIKEIKIIDLNKRNENIVKKILNYLLRSYSY